MSDRYRPRARSPMRDPARSSLQSFNYGTYPELHAIPTRREIIQSPRSSVDRSLHTPVVTTTYKITPDTSTVQRSNSTRPPSRNRRSTLEGATRPTIINSPAARRTQPSGRPSSPLGNPYRSSDEGEFYAVPASSIKTRSHRHRPAYSTTIDNSDMNRASRENGSSSLLRTGSGRNGPTYPQSRSRPTEPQTLVRHPDTMADDYGVNGYGYTNPRDVVQYDLARSAPKYYDERRDSYTQPSSRAARPASLGGVQDVVPRQYDNRGGPPTSSRGFDRIPRQPMYEPQPTIRLPSVERSGGRSDSVYQEPKRRPQSMYQQDDRPRQREEFYDPRDDDLRREPKRAERSERPYQDDVEGRGFGIRTDRADRASPPRIHDRRHEHERRDDRRPERRDDYDDRKEEKKEKKKSSGRDALATALSIGGAAFGISGLADLAGGRSERPESDRDSDGKEESRRKRDDEHRRRRERDDEEARDLKERNARDDRDKKERREKEPETVDLGGRNPQEKKSSKDNEFTPPSSREDSPPFVEPVSKPRRIASTAAPAFNPKDTMDLRALKEALNKQDGPATEPVPIPVKTRDSKSSHDSHAASSFDPRDPNSLSNIKAELRTHEADDQTTTPRSRPRGNSFLPPEVLRVESPTSTISIVSPPSHDDTSAVSAGGKPSVAPVKGILRAPREKFPEEANPIREGVAPLKDSKKDGIPPDARWTKISRHMVNPEALTLGKERFEARDDCVIVLRVLSKEEVQGYAEVTQKIRSMRPKDHPRAIAAKPHSHHDQDDDEDEEEDRERRRRRRDRHERHDRERERGEREVKTTSSGRSKYREHGGHRDQDRDADYDKLDERGDRGEHSERRGSDREKARTRGTERDRERDRGHERQSSFEEVEGESDTTEDSHEDDFVDLGKGSRRRNASRERPSGGRERESRRSVGFDAGAGKGKGVDDASYGGGDGDMGSLKENGDGTFTGYVRNPPAKERK